MTEQEKAGLAIVAWAKRSYEPISSEEGEIPDMHRQGLLSGMRVDLLSIEPVDDMWKARLNMAGGRFELIATFWTDDVHQLAENRLHIENIEREG